MVAVRGRGHQSNRAWVACLKIAASLALLARLVWLQHEWHPTVQEDGGAPSRRIITPPRIAGTTQSNREKGMFELARSQSFGFFYDIPDGHWRRLQKRFREHQNHRFPERPLTYHPEATADESMPEIYANRHSEWAFGWSSYPAWYQNNYEPNFACQFEKRVGDPMNGDGPKWVCDVHRIKRLARERKRMNPSHPGCVIYSVGSNGDFTFELGMQQEVGVGTCEYHIFDPGDFAHKRPPELKRAHYHRWGLTKQNQKEPEKSWWGFEQQEKSALRETLLDIRDEFRSLHDTVKTLGHENLDVIDIFKIDCERCEWQTYNDWLSAEVPLLHQILVVVHEAPKDKALDFFNSLERAGYLRFHKEPNIQWGPSCIEYGFVRVDEPFLEGKDFG